MNTTALAAMPVDGAHLDRWLTAIAEVAQAVTAGEDIERVYDLIAAVACELTGTQFAAVQVLDHDGQSLQIVGSQGLSEEYIKHANSTGMISLVKGSPFYESPSSQAFRFKKTVVIADAASDETYAPWRHIAEQQGYRALIAVPMFWRERPIGILACYTAEQMQPNERVVELVGLLTSHAAIAIVSSRNQERERSAIKRLVAANKELTKQKDELERVDQLQRDLTRIVMEKGDVEAVASAVARVLQLPIAVVSDDGALLAVAGAKDDTDATELATFVQNTMQDDSGASQPAPTGSRLVLAGPNPTAHAGAWVAPVLLGDGMVATVWAVGPTEPPGSLDSMLLERSAAVVALEMWQEQTALEIEWRLADDLLDDILRENPAADQTAVLARAQRLKYDLDEPHRIVLVRTEDEPDLSPTVADLRRRSVMRAFADVGRHHQRDVIVGWRKTAVVGLVSDADGGDRSFEQFVNDLRREVVPAAGRRPVALAIGAVCESLEDYGPAMRAATGALDLAAHGNANAQVWVEDFGVYTILLQSSRRQDLVAFSRQALAAIRDYDSRKDAGLAETLRAFFDSNCNAGDAAKILVIHPNTANYRLHRIEDLVGGSLRSPDVIVRLRLALMIDSALRS